MSEQRPQYVYTLYMKPVIDYIIGLAEAIALAAAFRVAADQTDSYLIDAMAFLLVVCVGGYVGLPFGLLSRPLGKIKTRSIWLALAIALPPSILSAWGAIYIGQTVSAAVKSMGKIGG